nr:SDR family oxidoreductase [Acidobacteriota bacterium]
ALGRDRCDISNRHSTHAALEELRPWAVVNAAGYVRVDEAERDADACLRLNTDGPAALAAACAERGTRFVTFSSDLVFDGQLRRPYVETDRAVPLNVYGISKLEAESRIRDLYPEALIIRTSAFFGPEDDYNFLTVALRALAEGIPFPAAHDTTISPTYVPDLVNAALDLLVDGERGVWHLANPGEITWAGFARAAAQQAGLNSSLVVDTPMHGFDLPAPRPAYSALGSIRGTLLPPLDHAIERYVAATEPRRADDVARVSVSPSVHS